MFVHTRWFENANERITKAHRKAKNPSNQQGKNKNKKKRSRRDVSFACIFNSV